MAAGIAGIMWVSLELAGPVSDIADSAWYIALGLAIAAVAAVVFVTARSRTRGMVGLTAATTVLLVAVVLTYPTDAEPCTPGHGGAVVTDTTSDLCDGIQVDADVPGAADANDCK
jgi:hypothetical protein